MHRHFKYIFENEDKNPHLRAYASIARKFAIQSSNMAKLRRLKAYKDFMVSGDGVARISCYILNDNCTVVTSAVPVKIEKKKDNNRYFKYVLFCGDNDHGYCCSEMDSEFNLTDIVFYETFEDLSLEKKIVPGNQLYESFVVGHGADIYSREFSHDEEDGYVVGTALAGGFVEGLTNGHCWLGENEVVKDKKPVESESFDIFNDFFDNDVKDSNSICSERVYKETKVFGLKKVYNADCSTNANIFGHCLSTYKTMSFVTSLLGVDFGLCRLKVDGRLSHNKFKYLYSQAVDFNFSVGSQIGAHCGCDFESSGTLVNFTYSHFHDPDLDKYSGWRRGECYVYKIKTPIGDFTTEDENLSRKTIVESFIKNPVFSIEEKTVAEPAIDVTDGDPISINLLGDESNSSSFVATRAFLDSMMYRYHPPEGIHRCRMRNVQYGSIKIPRAESGDASSRLIFHEYTKSSNIEFYYTLNRFARFYYEDKVLLKEPNYTEDAGVFSVKDSTGIRLPDLETNLRKSTRKFTELAAQYYSENTDFDIDGPEVVPGTLGIYNSLIGDALDENIPGYIQEVFKLTNDVRQYMGLNRLSFNYSLYLAGMMYITEQSWSGQFGHISLAGQDVLDRVKYCQYGTKKLSQVSIGENLAYIPNSTPMDAIEGWWNSPGHKANMLNPFWKDLGVGLIKSRPGTIFPNGTTDTYIWIQVFGVQY